MGNIKLTREEKELILARRKEDDLPKKIGFLKEDLYTNYDAYDRGFRINSWYLSLKEREQVIKNFADTFELAVPAGSKFVCFINSDGSEAWYDDINYGIENRNAEWALKYLRDIKTIKKNNGITKSAYQPSKTPIVVQVPPSAVFFHKRKGAYQLGSK